MNELNHKMNTTQEYRTCSDVPFSYILLTDSQDTQPVREDFGCDYDSFFVQIENGDYLHVYGFYGIMPTSDRRVYRVR